MTDPKTLALDHRELAETLIRHFGIHEGYWGVYMEFGIQGVNIESPEKEAFPAALIPVRRIGIQPFDEPNPLSVDASEVNPKKSPSRKKAKSRGKK